MALGIRASWFRRLKSICFCEAIRPYKEIATMAKTEIFSFSICGAPISKAIYVTRITFVYSFIAVGTSLARGFRKLREALLALVKAA